MNYIYYRSVYEATRIALDLKQLEEKKDSLVTIKERLIKESKSPDSLKSMGKADNKKNKVLK